jgi:hypothetical protein
MVRLRRLTAFALGFALAFGMLAQPAAACRWPAGGTTYMPNNIDAEQFQFGQHSQGGNYYYGVTARMTNTFPPDPVDGTNWSAKPHAASIIGSSDDVSTGHVYTGWAVGWLGDYRATSTIVFAEYFSYTGAFVQSPGGVALSSLWYRTQLAGSLGGGLWRYDALVHNGSEWELLTGNYATLITPTTAQDAFGETTDKVLRDANDQIIAQGTCILQSSPNTAVNWDASLQLLVDNVTWQHWSPANGRWADAVWAPPYYRDDPNDYTDLHLGGPRP